MQDSKPSSIPMQVKLKLEKEPDVVGENKLVDTSKYQELIGSIMHLAVYSRPDIAFSISTLSQFSQNPKKQHWTTALNLLRYLNTTKTSKLVYSKTGLPLVGYVDASWAEDRNDCKSQSGYCFVFAGAAVSWESRKQRTVATSSAEAEYIALTEGAKEAYSLRNLLQELNFACFDATTIFCDNQSAQHIAEYGGKYSRTKHIHYKYHFIREAIEKGIVSLKYLQTDKMVADSLTNAVPKDKHYFCFKRFGVNYEI